MLSLFLILVFQFFNLGNATGNNAYRILCMIVFYVIMI